MKHLLLLPVIFLTWASQPTPQPRVLKEVTLYDATTKPHYVETVVTHTQSRPGKTTGTSKAVRRIRNRTSGGQLPLPPGSIAKIIREEAHRFGVSENLLVRILWCESKYRTDARNKTSSAKGIAQWLDYSWRGTLEGKQGKSPFDPQAAIRAMARSISVIGTSKWTDSKSCWL